jgi:hypothetical protein
MISSLKLSLIAYIVYALILSVVAITPFSIVYAHQHQHTTKCKWPFSALYVYPNPIQGPLCMILTHNGKVVNASGVPIK